MNALSLRPALSMALWQRFLFWGLLLLIAQQLAALSWRLWLPEPAPSAMTPVAQASSAPPTETRATAALTLFGSPTDGRMPSAAVDPALLTDIPVTALKLRLTGVLASPDPKRAIAIIAKENQQFSRSVGETVPGYEARVAAISAERVVLEHQGRYEALRLYDDAAPPLAAGGEPSIAQVKERLQSKPMQVMDYITISPVMVDNALSGYRLNPGKQSELFHRVGLHENDLAVALNGLDLRDAQQAQQAMEQLPNLNEINLTIEREGQRQEIYLVAGDD
ncbi:type II secretion system protein GspC [Brenneria goodwinii]|uniref:General secretion pathway protein C n=1 Tax=Brenneria goodwinii TaxID=1109412 RepID=A0A0G4JZK4_9GAMM|nr:type II secretion system protein GspC [Brenneria goodwinii]CPR19675.1 General secretion pathway protein C [Brenneria goodwinii]